MCSLHLDARLEVVLDATIDFLHVAATSGASAPPFDGLDAPVESPTGWAWIGTGGTPLPLIVERVTATSAAEDVRAPVTRTHAGRSLCH